MTLLFTYVFWAVLAGTAAPPSSISTLTMMGPFAGRTNAEALANCEEQRSEMESLRPVPNVGNCVPSTPILIPAKGEGHAAN